MGEGEVPLLQSPKYASEGLRKACQWKYSNQNLETAGGVSKEHRLQSMKGRYLFGRTWRCFRTFKVLHKGRNEMQIDSFPTDSKNDRDNRFKWSIRYTQDESAVRYMRNYGDNEVDGKDYGANGANEFRWAILVKRS
jgi:hypothetical protein